jgi:hypothetical protein
MAGREYTLLVGTWLLNANWQMKLFTESGHPLWIVGEVTKAHGLQVILS